ncbi:MAG TPA: GH3 auxin-responsive promoter family protein, partial [Anaerolineae bacterium]|nr:GH3 auxin-responsive promoter family protein [Anaerolineae bacterium]
RLAKGLIRSKLAGRPLLPKDLWSVKAVAAGGTDMDIFRDRIEHYWGRAPLEGYACTELGLTSFTTWNTSLTFVPDMSFWEFIPEKEHLKSRQDPAYQPRTLLLDQVRPGEIYEIVGTSFHGGAFVRYRVGDLIKITALRDEEHGIDIPQMVFHSRADDIIDLSGFTRLTERSIAWALENAKIAYSDWTARKDVGEAGPRVHLYIERTDHEHRDAQAIGQAVHERLKDLEPEYRDWTKLLGGVPPSVTLLSPGTFERYMAERQAEGADLAQLKPVRMKPSDKVIGDLLRMGA